MESQWALANFTVPPECACVCAFGANSTVYGKSLFTCNINGSQDPLNHSQLYSKMAYTKSLHTAFLIYF